MTPLGVGQHFCLGLVKFMELVHHHHSLAEEGQTQTEKTVKMSVMLTRYVQAPARFPLPPFSSVSVYVVD